MSKFNSHTNNYIYILTDSFPSVIPKRGIAMINVKLDLESVQRNTQLKLSPSFLVLHSLVCQTASHILDIPKTVRKMLTFTAFFSNSSLHFYLISCHFGHTLFINFVTFYSFSSCLFLSFWSVVTHNLLNFSLFIFGN